ncbi:TetR/AcrR family transcriptional regulator [Streptomyces sp. NRRL B-24572]|uniref:TetR/AcrR family transcriptional regulator n=1 Tax=Streptomyces sp. NRRL B-24572 TaxID=1962156 RepID=UPI000A3AFF92|nr:TetR/AcrR family transcriptional regulator [Streptomyces sp. NRRL B-24572]
MAEDRKTHDDGRPDGRDTRWTGHRAERRDQVLTAALTVIGREGTAVSVAAIGAEAGMPRSVVYRIFRSREDLDEQIRARITDDLMAALSPALAPRGTIREAIEHAAGTYASWVALHPELHRFLGGGSPAVTGTRTAIALHLARLLDSYAERFLDGEPAPAGFNLNLAFGMVGLVDGVVNQWAAHPESRSSLDDLTHFLSDALWGVLASATVRLGITLDPDQPTDLT